MIHFNDNKRANLSAQLIFDGLCKCLKNKSFNEVTITDVQKASTVARSTFYRLFDNLLDVLCWKCDLCFQKALEFDFTEFNEWELVRGYFEYWTKNSEILEVLVDNNMSDLIATYHLKNAEKLAKSYGTLPDMDEEDLRYFMAIRTGVTVGVLKAWVKGGKKQSAQQLSEILKKQFILLAKEIKTTNE